MDKLEPDQTSDGCEEVQASRRTAALAQNLVSLYQPALEESKDHLEELLWVFHYRYEYDEYLKYKVTITGGAFVKTWFQPITFLIYSNLLTERISDAITQQGR